MQEENKLFNRRLSNNTNTNTKGVMPIIGSNNQYNQFNNYKKDQNNPYSNNQVNNRNGPIKYYYIIY